MMMKELICRHVNLISEWYLHETKYKLHIDNSVVGTTSYYDTH